MSDELDAERTRNYAARLVVMAEEGVTDAEAYAQVLREHAAGPPPSPSVLLHDKEHSE